MRRQLNTLPPAVAERVAKHLVAAGQLLDSDPPAAHKHAVYAREQAARVAATREAAGITGYLVGDYAQALADLRTVRRMTGETRHLAIMADCERGLGRPERAVELAQEPDAGRLDDDTTVELMIVLSGARRDLGQFDAAVAALEGPYLDTERVATWTPRLWYAYADALIAAGRAEEGVQWLRSVAVIDTAEETDAAERIAELDGEPDDAGSDGGKD